MTYGTNIAKFPAGATLVKSRLSQVTASGQGSPGEHTALGWARSGKGVVMVLGDSNCLDSSHAVRGGMGVVAASHRHMCVNVPRH